MEFRNGDEVVGEGFDGKIYAGIYDDAYRFGLVGTDSMIYQWTPSMSLSMTSSMSLSVTPSMNLSIIPIITKSLRLCSGLTKVEKIILGLPDDVGSNL